MPTETTDDSLGGLTIRQHKKGYRFGLDAVLLATDLPDLPPAPRIADLGAGQGAVTCVAARLTQDAQLVAVERQQGLADLLRHNAEHNGFKARVHVVEHDLRDRAHLEPHTCDLVLMNPPYYLANSGQMSAIVERAEAHYELHGTISDFVEAAQYMAKPGGWFKCILPPYRLADFLTATASSDFGVKSLRFFHTNLEEPAYLVEIRARRGGRFETEVLAPLVVYADNGEYGAEVTRRLEIP